jgi:hypothetical protein
MPKTLMLLVIVLLPSCAQPDEEGYLRDFEARLTGDLHEMDGTIVRVAEYAAELPEVLGRDNHEPECIQAGGDCTVCYDVTGLPLQGMFTVGLDPLPCGVSVTNARDLTSTYSVTESTLEGSWTGTTAGDYDIVATGSRAASLSLETSLSGTLDYDSSFEITEMAATTEAAALESYAIEMAYLGFSERVWTVNVAGTATGVLGTVTAPGDRSCTIDGTFDNVDVRCTGPETD